MAGEESNILKELSRRAVSEFEELKKKCKEHHDKYTHERDKVQRLESQFKQLKRVSLLAVSEYDNLFKRYSEETKLKLHVENRYKQVEDENKELRKVNKFSAKTAILPTNEKDSASKGELEGLRALLSGMKEEFRRTKSDFTKLQDQFTEEKQEHEGTKQKLKIGAAQMKQLNRVSVLALDEFQELRKKYESEAACRKKAEEYASEVLRDSKLSDRRSELLNQQVNSDERLQSAIREVENLTKILDEEKRNGQKKIKELEEELDTSKDDESVKSMEDKMSVALDQVELLQKQLGEAEGRANDTQRKLYNMEQKLLRAEAIASGMAVPPPPPPAPPPPPPIPAPALRKFISKIGGKKKRPKGGEIDEKGDSTKVDMMNELMKRIELRSQGLLRQANPARVQKDDKDEGTAMNELAGLLGNFRHGRASSKEKVLPEKEKKEPAFLKLKLRKTSTKSEASHTSDGTENELMKKLERRKESVEQFEKMEILPDSKRSLSIREETEPQENDSKSKLVNSVTTDEKCSEQEKCGERPEDGQCLGEIQLPNEQNPVEIITQQKSTSKPSLDTLSSDAGKESEDKKSENEVPVAKELENETQVVQRGERELVLNNEAKNDITEQTPPVETLKETNQIVSNEASPSLSNEVEKTGNGSFDHVEDNLSILMKSLEEFSPS